MKTVVIVGAGFGGLSAAKKLSNADAKIIVIDRNNHHLFQPLLYQVATAGLSPADIAIPIRSILSGAKNVEVLMQSVSGVDLKNSMVLLENQNIQFDYLILATGSEYNYFGHPEWQEVAPSLKTLSDATAIRQQILSAFEKAEIEENKEIRKMLLTFVLVGGGPTGVEMAGAIAELAKKGLKKDFRNIQPETARIILCEASPNLLSSFPTSLVQKAKRALEKLGVEIRTDSPVTALTKTSVQIGSETIQAGTVIWTAGVKSTSITQKLGTSLDGAGKVPVEPDLSIKGFPNSFVIGDAARVLDETQKLLPAVAPVAMQQGRFVGNLILKQLKGEKPNQKFVYINKGNLATVGRSFAIAEIGPFKLSGMIAWLIWTIVHIYYLINFRNRFIVMFEWAWAYFTFGKGARLILNNKKKETV